MKNIYIEKKLLLVLLVVMSGLISCKKEVRSVTWNNPSLANDNNSTIGLTEDEKLRMITIDIPAQTVKTSVNGTTLIMMYKEDVSALLDHKGFDLSYSIRFNEDFSASSLSKFSYTLPAPNGLYTTNWAGNDLKVLNEVTKTDVVVDGKAMVKLHLVRYFTFTKEFSTVLEAVAQQNALLNTKNDVVKFTGYVVFGKDYPSTSATVSIVYNK